MFLRVSRFTKLASAVAVVAVASIACSSGGTSVASPSNDPVEAASAATDASPATTPTLTLGKLRSSSSSAPDSIVKVTPPPDLIVIEDKDEELERAQFSTRGWKTDFSRRTVAISDSFSGGPGKDGIPAIDNPQFESMEDAGQWLVDNEPLQTVDINGEVKAYPLGILIWHEIVNDTVGGVPVVVTYCPLCNSALTFDRRLGDRLLDFGSAAISGSAT